MPADNAKYPRHAKYVGRFAPSPTGPLHTGSLIGALASYLDARSQNGTWLLRMENIDPPREIEGSDKRIIKTLLSHGFEWDGEMLEQSSRSTAYETVLAQLLDSGQAFYCSCSRRQLTKQGGMHQGHCIGPVDPTDCAIRLRVPDRDIKAVDKLQPPLVQNLQRHVGDFILKRRDGYYAYQLAVVVDDAFQGVNHVVRGSDLWDSTPRQLYLQEVLRLSHPTYLHFPVMLGEDGHKLSKQTFAAPVDDSNACNNLLLALRFLGQSTPPDTMQSSPQKILDWAALHWSRQQIPPVMGQAASEFYNE